MIYVALPLLGRRFGVETFMEHTGTEYVLVIGDEVEERRRFDDDDDARAWALVRIGGVEVLWDLLRVTDDGLVAVANEESE